jgi:hypothetical protein
MAGPPKFTNQMSEQSTKQLHAEHFVEAFDALQAFTHYVNVSNGFWDARREIVQSKMPAAEVNVIIACLGLVTSEVAEAMEAARKHKPETWKDADTKDTLVRELAGTVIRCMDLAEELGLPLARAIVVETSANANRGYMHGGKAA